MTKNWTRPKVFTKKARINVYQTKYQIMRHMESQSNVVDRLLSLEKLIMTSKEHAPYISLVFFAEL